MTPERLTTEHATKPPAMFQDDWTACMADACAAVFYGSRYCKDPSRPEPRYLAQYASECMVVKGWKVRP
jgi:hypothetical protein